jgi:hypothetical protein
MLNPKTAGFLHDLLTLSTRLIIDNYSELAGWSDKCCNRIVLFNSEYAKLSQFKNMTRDGYSSHIILSGSIFNFYHMTARDTVVAIYKAIGSLCFTKNREHYFRAQQILFFSTPEILAFNVDVLKKCNNLLIGCFLESFNDVDLVQAIPLMFSHLSDAELKRECYDISDERFEKYCFIWIGKKDIDLPEGESRESLILKIKHFQLATINNNIGQIIESRLPLLPKLIDYLNSNFIPGLSRSYKMFPNYIVEMLLTLSEGCEKLQHIDPSLSALAYKKLSVLICTHGFISKVFSKCFTGKKENILHFQVQRVQGYYEKLETITSNKNALLESRPDRWLELSELNNYESIDDEIALRHQWCELSFQVFKDSPIPGDTNFEIWLNLMKDEFIECFDISGEAMVWGSLTIHLLTLFGNVLEIVGKIGGVNPNFAVTWYASFIHELENRFRIGNKRWYSAVIAEKLSTAMTKELLPCLKLLENFYKEFNPYNDIRTCVDAYYNLIEDGVVNEYVFHKAIIYSKQLSSKIKLFVTSEDELTTYEGMIHEQNTNYTKKFQSVYLIEINSIFLSFEENFEAEKNNALPVGESQNIFLERWSLFRSCTDETFCKLCSQNQTLPCQILVYFLKKTHLLSKDAILNEIVEYLVFILKHCRKPSEYEEEAFHNFYTSCLYFAVFFGPDPKNNKSNFLIDDMYGKYTANNLFFVNYFHSQTMDEKLLLIWCLLEDIEKPSLTWKLIHNKTLTNSIFRKMAQVVFQTMKYQFLNYKVCRPQFTEWYDSWIAKVDHYLNYLR